jgi:hypothetical protein
VEGTECGYFKNGICIVTFRSCLLFGKLNYRIRDSVVGIATGYGLDDRGVGVRVPVGSIIFSSPRRPDRFWGPPAQSPIQWVPEALSPGVKQPEREADYSPPTSAEVKKARIYTSTPPYAFMA